MFNKKEIIDILKDDKINQELFSKADKIRQEYIKNIVHLRGLIEFSSFCKNTCYYCGLRCENKNLQRYRILKDEILSIAKEACEAGYKTIVLQSGEDSFFTKDKMAEIISEIKSLNVVLTLSIGEKSYDDLKFFKSLGVDRYLLRIETSNENLYQKLHPNMSFKNRIDCLYNIKELGFETGSGSIIGLIGQDINLIADDILFFKNLEPDMLGIGPFIPHQQTPLRNEKIGDFTLTLKVLALLRILLPKINIPATTALETLQKEGRIKGLQVGANVIMPNLTPEKYAKNYQIYPNKAFFKNTPLELRKNIEKELKKIDRVIK